MATKSAAKPKAKVKAKEQSPADIVRASAGNPDASRAGVSNVHAAPASENGRLDGCQIETVDGARANVSFNVERATQDELFALRKLLDSAIQETY